MHGPGELLPPSVATLLVILPSWVGDTCMATASLRHLRAHAPRARIVAFGRPSLAPLIVGLPFVDAFIGGSMRGFAAVDELRRVRRERADAALILPNSFRSALFARAASIPRRAGSARDGRSWLMSVAVDDPRRLRTAADSYARLVGAWTGTPVDNVRPELCVTEAERAGAAVILGESATPTRRWLLLNPGANRDDKRWSAARFAAAARAIAQAAPATLARDRIAVTGSPGEAALCREIAQLSGAIDLCAKGIALGTLKGVLERTALLLTNDTGPSHMAAALATPTITLFGPTDQRWTPGDAPLERRLIAEPFLTDDALADEFPKACAIDRIAVSDVVHAARALLARSTEVTRA